MPRPGRPVRLVVCGAGLIGRRHMELIAAHPGCALAAIAEPHWPTGVTAPVPVHPDLAAALAAVGGDAVVIASPTDLHEEHALAGIAAGKPVLVEKPVAADLDAAGRIAAAARAAGVPVLVGHQRRHSLVVREARRLLADGAIGELTTLAATWWVAKPPAYFDQEWRAGRGGGPLLINAIHDIDTLRHLIGEITGCQAISAPPRRAGGNEDSVACLLRFANGVVGTLSVSDITPGPWSWEFTAAEQSSFAHTKTGADTYRIGGTLGALEVPSLRQWRHDGAPDWLTPLRSVGERPAACSPLALQLDHFLDVVRGVTPPLVDATDAMASLRVALDLRRLASADR